MRLEKRQTAFVWTDKQRFISTKRPTVRHFLMYWTKLSSFFPSNFLTNVFELIFMIKPSFFLSFYLLFFLTLQEWKRKHLRWFLRRWWLGGRHFYLRPRPSSAEENRWERRLLTKKIQILKFKKEDFLVGKFVRSSLVFSSVVKKIFNR